MIAAVNQSVDCLSEEPMTTGGQWFIIAKNEGETTYLVTSFSFFHDDVALVCHSTMCSTCLALTTCCFLDIAWISWM